MQSYTPVAQWIEHCPPEAGAAVRLRPGVYLNKEVWMGRPKMIVSAILIFVIVGTGLFFLTKDSRADHTTEKTEKVEIQTEDKNTNPLEKNKYAAITILIQDYYKKVALGDTDGLSTIVAVLDDTKASHIKNAEKFTEAYTDINVYTKEGKQKDSYIAFASYKMKIRDIDTLVPGLDTFYIQKGTGGTYQICDVPQYGETADYIADVTQEEDVQELVHRVQEEYTQATAGDATLQQVLDDLQSAYGNE